MDESRQIFNSPDPLFPPKSPDDASKYIPESIGKKSPFGGVYLPASHGDGQHAVLCDQVRLRITSEYKSIKIEGRQAFSSAWEPVPDVWAALEHLIGAGDDMNPSRYMCVTSACDAQTLTWYFNLATMNTP